MDFSVIQMITNGKTNEISTQAHLHIIVSVRAVKIKKQRRLFASKEFTDLLWGKGRRRGWFPVRPNKEKRTVSWDPGYNIWGAHEIPPTFQPHDQYPMRFWRWLEMTSGPSLSLWTEKIYGWEARHPKRGFQLQRNWLFLKVNLIIHRKFWIGGSGAKNSGMVSDMPS